MHFFHYNKSDLAFQQLSMNQTESEDDISEGITAGECPYKEVEEGPIISHDSR